MSASLQQPWQDRVGTTEQLQGKHMQNSALHSLRRLVERIPNNWRVGMTGAAKAKANNLSKQNLMIYNSPPFFEGLGFLGR